MPFARLFAIFLIALLAAPTLSAQQQSASDPSGAGAPASYPEINEVHVDQFCRVLPPGHPPPRLRRVPRSAFVGPERRLEYRISCSRAEPAYAPAGATSW